MDDRSSEPETLWRRPWTERDRSVVWHGFTQMAVYAGVVAGHRRPADGRYLIDVEGRRYFDGFSSLWVNTLGHRVPELDAAVVASWTRSPTRRCSETATGSCRARRGARRLVPVDTPTSSSHPTEPPESSRRSRSPSSTGSTPGIRAEPRTWRSVTPTTGTRSARSRSATAGSGPICTILSGSRSSALPATRTRDGWTRRSSSLEHHAEELAAAVVEPVVQGASGHARGGPRDVGVLRCGMRRSRGPLDRRRGRDRDSAVREDVR